MKAYTVTLAAGVAIAVTLNFTAFRDRDSRHALAPVLASNSGPLFATARPRSGPGPAGKACLSAEQMLVVFTQDAEAVGGEILVLTGGIEQEIADQWRREVGMTPVDVSQLMAHFVPGEDGEEIVDVVEIDTRGCALSRTLMSDIGWSNLVKSAWGVEV